MKCPKCGKITVFDFSKCPSCGHNPYEANDNQKAEHESSVPGTTSESQSTPQIAVGSGAIQTLRFFAWLDLIAGFSGAIWIWSEFGKRISPGYQYATESNPVGIAIGIAVLLQGIFVCAFFLVIASIADNLIEIRRNTDSRSE